jgi:hypothetical protein
MANLNSGNLTGWVNISPANKKAPIRIKCKVRQAHHTGTWSPFHILLGTAGVEPMDNSRKEELV